MSKTFIQQLPVMLTDAEKIQFGVEQSRQVREQLRLQDAKKEAAAQFKSEIDACGNEIKRISYIISSGQEWRDVECQKHFTDGMILITRLDTGELIERRKATPEEQQMALDLM